MLRFLCKSSIKPIWNVNIKLLVGWKMFQFPKLKWEVWAGFYIIDVLYDLICFLFISWPLPVSVYDRHSLIEGVNNIHHQRLPMCQHDTPWHTISRHFQCVNMTHLPLETTAAGNKKSGWCRGDDGRSTVHNPSCC